MSNPQGPWGNGGYGPPPPPPNQYPQQYQYPPPPVFYAPTQQVIVQQMKAPFRHGIHLVLDFITCGLWIPVHLIAWALS